MPPARLKPIYSDNARPRTLDQQRADAGMSISIDKARCPSSDTHVRLSDGVVYMLQLAIDHAAYEIPRKTLGTS
jgi:hypothetical protein